jgi:hypothetical protein
LEHSIISKLYPPLLYYVISLATATTTATATATATDADADAATDAATDATNTTGVAVIIPGGGRQLNGHVNNNQSYER